MKVKEESEKVGLKLNIQKTQIVASGPITSWQIDEETMVTVTDYFGGSKITADGDCSHIKGRLLLERKAMINLDSILKSRDITLPTKACIVKEKEVAQSCPTLCDPVDCSPPGSSVHGIAWRGKHTGVGCRALLQGIFPTQGLSPSLLRCGQILYR